MLECVEWKWYLILITHKFANVVYLCGESKDICMKRKQNSYVVYDPKNDYQGTSFIEYVAYAYNESQVRLMAEEKGIDLTGYVIELLRTNVHDELGRPFKCEIVDAVVQ